MLSAADPVRPRQPRRLELGKVWIDLKNIYIYVYIRRPCLALAEAGRRLGPPQVWNFAFGNRPKQHRSRPAMPPQCPATPRTAILASESRPASAGPVFVQQWRQVASQAQDSSYVDSESDGWHLGLERPRRASVFVQQWRHSGQPGPGQQLYGFRKRRMAPQPAQSSSSNGASVVRTAVIWLPKATDGTSGLKTLAAPQPAQSSSSNGASVASQAQDSSYMDSENDGWHLGLQRPRRASPGPVMLSESDGWHLGLAAPQPAQCSSSNGAKWPARTAVRWIPKAADWA